MNKKNPIHFDYIYMQQQQQQQHKTMHDRLEVFFSMEGGYFGTSRFHILFFFISIFLFHFQPNNYNITSFFSI